MSRFLGDLSGAFADLGTFLPLIVGMFAVAQLDPVGVMSGFGLFALAVAVVYRRPVPVQPMKAVAALVIAGGLGAADVAASGILLAVVLLLIMVSGLIGRLARLVPETVMFGIQLGVGLHLALAGSRLVVDDPGPGVVALAFLLTLQLTRWRLLGVPLVLVAGIGYALSTGSPDLAGVSPGLYLPQWHWPEMSNFVVAATDVLVPQLALTLTNATLITAAIAAERFPNDRQRITPRNLAASTGGLNLLLAPFGAFPMCHGAGGLVVQYRFGARTGLAPALFGTSCLALGVLFGPAAADLLTLIPLAVVGAMLAIAGVELAMSSRLFGLSADRLVVVVLIGLTSIAANVAAAVVVGLLLEAARARYALRGR
ncbi:MAG: putative sulfate/molybdate transporter [Gammaproteobacteria bacterium]|nr:putative sulfate/molybdate transporter [Gammaproteobacteria bacterium]